MTLLILEVAMIRYMEPECSIRTSKFNFQFLQKICFAYIMFIILYKFNLYHSVLILLIKVQLTLYLLLWFISFSRRAILGEIHYIDN